MRNISFSATLPQFRAQTKTVTRRRGWGWLKPGTVLSAVEKAMGLKKGERLKRIGTIRVVSVRREQLDAITPEDCIAEGFPEMSPEDFVAFFCAKMGAKPSDIVTRIEFEYFTPDP